MVSHHNRRKGRRSDWLHIQPIKKWFSCSCIIQLFDAFKYFIPCFFLFFVFIHQLFLHSLSFFRWLYFFHLRDSLFLFILFLFRYLLINIFFFYNLLLFFHILFLIFSNICFKLYILLFILQHSLFICFVNQSAFNLFRLLHILFLAFFYFIWLLFNLSCDLPFADSIFLHFSPNLLFLWRRKTKL